MNVTDLVWMEVGEKYAVALTREVADELTQANAKGQGRVRALMKFFLNRGPVGMRGDDFPHEDRITVGKPPKKVSVYAFKGHQVRVYGDTYTAEKPYKVEGHKKKPVLTAMCNGKEFHVPGKSVFLGTSIDIHKKQDDADEQKLKSAANLLFEIMRE